MLSVIIVNYNDWKNVFDYTKSILNYISVDHIVIIDNNSNDSSYKELLNHLRDEKRVTVFESGKNGGYGFGNNIGIKYAIEKFDSDYVLISNSDVRYDDTTIFNMLEILQSNPDIAAVAPKMLDLNNDLVKNCAWKIPSKKQAIKASLIGISKIPELLYDLNDKKTLKYVDCIAGSLLLVRTDAFRQISGYDENIFLFGEETVLGIRLKQKGWKSAIALQNHFVHAHSVSISKTYKSKKQTDKLTWNSRKYILKHYYQCNSIELLILEILVRCHIELSFLKHSVVK
jgi:GT2 family glycosyltransferase